VLRWAGLILGTVFVYASYDKIAEPVAFAKIVYRYGLLGPGRPLGALSANLLAVILPWVELVTGLALIGGVWRREAATVAGLLLLMFIGAVGWTLLAGIDVGSCGCFTVSDAGRQASWQLIGLDLGLLVLAAWVALPPARPASTSEQPAAAQTSAG
jgi:uncharacterized membrane protein YphA (DoxX/SURF4 family)